jgi:hypothetical protein
VADAGPAKKHEPGRHDDARARSVFALRAGRGEMLSDGRSEAGGGCPRWTTRRRSTVYTTPLAYGRIVQRTTSFHSGFWRLMRRCQRTRGGRIDPSHCVGATDVGIIGTSCRGSPKMRPAAPRKKRRFPPQHATRQQVTITTRGP